LKSTLTLFLLCRWNIISLLLSFNLVLIYLIIWFRACAWALNGNSCPRYAPASPPFSATSAQRSVTAERWRDLPAAPLTLHSLTFMLICEQWRFQKFLIVAHHGHSVNNLSYLSKTAQKWIDSHIANCYSIGPIHGSTTSNLDLEIPTSKQNRSIVILILSIG